MQLELESEIATERTAQEKVVTFLIYLSIFVGSSIVFFATPFEGYFHYAVYLGLLPFFIRRFGVPRTPFKLLFFPLLVGIFQILMGNNSAFGFVKIFGGILLSVTFFYYVMEYYNRDIEKMFKIYLTWAYWSAIIAIFQYFSWQVRFTPGWDLHWILNKAGGCVITWEGAIRVASFYLEPSQLGIMLSPAAFVAAINLLRGKTFHYKKYQSIVILVALYMSRSSTGYLGLFLVLLIVGINYGYILYLFLFIVMGIFAAWGLYINVKEFRDRVDSSIGLWVDNDLSIKNVNSSSFVLYNNSHIAWENLKEHPLFGTGLGSHLMAYNKYTYTNDDKIRLEGFEFNTQDANSMFLRLMSETGLLGIVFALALVFRCFVGYTRNEDEDKYWIISGALLVIILLYLLRQGNYFLNGFPFFVWLYYYTREKFLENREEKYQAALEAERMAQMRF